MLKTKINFSLNKFPVSLKIEFASWKNWKIKSNKLLDCHPDFTNNKTKEIS